MSQGCNSFPNGTILKLIAMPNSLGEMYESSFINKDWQFRESYKPGDRVTNDQHRGRYSVRKNISRTRDHLEVLYSTWRNETSSNQIELGSRGLAYTIARAACVGACKPISKRFHSVPDSTLLMSSFTKPP